VRASGTLGDMSLIVLTAGKGALDMPLTSPDWVQFRDEWVNNLQMQLTHLSSKGKRIILADSGHNVPFDRPDAIVDAVSQIRDDTAANSR